MYKNQTVQTITELQKQGIAILLTDEGYSEILKLIQQEIAASEVSATEEQAG